VSYAASNPVQIGIESLRSPSAESCSGTRVGEEKREGVGADMRDPAGGERKRGARSPESERGGRRAAGAFWAAGKGGNWAEATGLAEIGWLLSLFFSFFVFFSILLFKAFSKDNLNANKFSQKKQQA